MATSNAGLTRASTDAAILSLSQSNPTSRAVVNTMGRAYCGQRSEASTLSTTRPGMIPSDSMAAVWLSRSRAAR